MNGISAPSSGPQPHGGMGIPFIGPGDNGVGTGEVDWITMGNKYRFRPDTNTERSPAADAILVAVFIHMHIIHL